MRVRAPDVCGVHSQKQQLSHVTPPHQAGSRAAVFVCLPPTVVILQHPFVTLRQSLSRHRGKAGVFADWCRRRRPLKVQLSMCMLASYLLGLTFKPMAEQKRRAREGGSQREPFVSARYFCRTTRCVTLLCWVLTVGGAAASDLTPSPSPSPSPLGRPRVSSNLGGSARMGSPAPIVRTRSKTMA